MVVKIGGGIRAIFLLRVLKDQCYVIATVVLGSQRASCEALIKESG